jgi:hypothetical protein
MQWATCGLLGRLERSLHHVDDPVGVRAGRGHVRSPVSTARPQAVAQEVGTAIPGTHTGPQTIVTLTVTLTATIAVTLTVTKRSHSDRLEST